LGSALPGPVWFPPWLSFCGALGLVVLFGLLPGLPPPRQLPPLHWPPWHWFSISLMSSSRRATTSFWSFWVLGPPRDRSRRRSMLSILRAMLPRSLSFQLIMSNTINAATIL